MCESNFAQEASSVLITFRRISFRFYKYRLLLFVFLFDNACHVSFVPKRFVFISVLFFSEVLKTAQFTYHNLTTQLF
jgi:hypothetical protein